MLEFKLELERKEKCAYALLLGRQININTKQCGWWTIAVEYESVSGYQGLYWTNKLFRSFNFIDVTLLISLPPSASLCTTQG